MQQKESKETMSSLCPIARFAKSTVEKPPPPSPSSSSDKRGQRRVAFEVEDEDDRAYKAQLRQDKVTQLSMIIRAYLQPLLDQPMDVGELYGIMHANHYHVLGNDLRRFHHWEEDVEVQLELDAVRRLEDDAVLYVIRKWNVVSSDAGREERLSAELRRVEEEATIWPQSKEAIESVEMEGD